MTTKFIHDHNKFGVVQSLIHLCNINVLKVQIEGKQ